MLFGVDMILSDYDSKICNICYINIIVSFE